MATNHGFSYIYFKIPSISIDFYRSNYNIINTTKIKVVFKIREKYLGNNSFFLKTNVTEWHSGILEKKNVLALQIAYKKGST